MATDITSDVTIIQMLSMVSYSVSWVGTTPVGTITVEVSNDYTQNADGTEKNPGTWNELPLSSTCAVTGDVDNGFIDIDASAGYAMRLKYNRTSGVGNMTVILTSKVA